MAPHASHAHPLGATARSLGHRHRRDWREAFKDKARFAWYPLWLATAFGITWAVVEFVNKGMPVLSIGGP